MSIQLLLCTGDALIHPTIELAYLFAYICTAIGTRSVFVTETKRSYLVLQRAQVSTNLVLQSVVTITIGNRELETAVLHRSCVHRHRGVTYTCVRRNGHTIKQIR